jgi:hypothetical protein
MSDKETGASHPEHPGGYEKKDTNVKKMALSALGTVAFIALASVVLNEYFVITEEQVYYEQVLRPVARDYQALRAREDSVLTTYELLDTAEQIYRVPIDSAMKLTAQEASRQ